MVIHGGILHTDRPGIIRLDADMVRQMIGEGAAPELVVEALSDYHYDNLSVSVNREQDGIYRMLLQAVGRNPALEGGRRVELNLNLSGNLDRIIGRILFLQEQMAAVEKIFSTTIEP